MISNQFSINESKYRGEIIKISLTSEQGDVYLASRFIKDGDHSGFISNVLLDIPTEQILPQRHCFLDSLIREIAPCLLAESQEEISKWIESLARKDPDRFISTLDALADKSLSARILCMELIPQLRPEQRRYQQARLLRLSPIEQHQPLVEFDKKSQLFLIDLYGKQIQSSALALQKVLQAVKGVKGTKGFYRDVVKKALKYIEYSKIPEGILSIENDLLPLLNSGIVKARVKSLELISRIQPRPSDEQLSKICCILTKEDNQQVVIRLCNLVKQWVNHRKYVPPNVTQVILDIPSRLSKNNQLDGGVLEVLVPTFTAISQRKNENIDIVQLVDRVRVLLNTIDIGRGESRKNVVSLLLAVDRLDKDFLSSLVDNECPELAEKGWEENLCAVTEAIQCATYSSLLEGILNLSRRYALSKVEGIVLRPKGL